MKWNLQRLPALFLYFVTATTVLVICASMANGQTEARINVSAANLRDDPSLTSAVIAKIPRGQIAKLLEPEAFGDWYYVEYKGKSGWLHKSTLELVTASATVGRPSGQGSGVSALVADELAKYSWGEPRHLFSYMLQFGVPKRPKATGPLQYAVLRMDRDMSVTDRRVYKNDKAISVYSVSCYLRKLQYLYGSVYDHRGLLRRFVRPQFNEPLNLSDIVPEFILKNACAVRPTAPTTRDLEDGDSSLPAGVGWVADTLSVEKAKYDWRQPVTEYGISRQVGARKQRSQAGMGEFAVESDNSTAIQVDLVSFDCRSREVRIKATGLYSKLRNGELLELSFIERKADSNSVAYKAMGDICGPASSSPSGATSQSRPANNTPRLSPVPRMPVNMGQINSLISSVPEQYRQSMRQYTSQADERVSVVVGKDGRVKQARLVDPQTQNGPRSQLALDAARATIFRPNIVNGTPVEYTGTIAFYFPVGAWPPPPRITGGHIHDAITNITPVNIKWPQNMRSRPVGRIRIWACYSMTSGSVTHLEWRTSGAPDWYRSQIDTYIRARRFRTSPEGGERCGDILITAQ